MGSHTERFLHDLPTFATLLGGEARIHSYHLMTSSYSLVTEDGEKCAPTGVHDALCEMVILCHVRNLKVFNCNQLIPFGVRLRCLEMVIAALTIDLHMRLRHILSSFASAMRALLAAAHRTLLASQCFLRRAIEARVFDGMALTISQERLQSYINADSRMRTGRGCMFGMGVSLAHDERVPMPISTMYKMHGFGGSLYRAVYLDFKEFSKFCRNMHVLLIFIQPYITGGSVLSESDGVPAIGLLKAGEPNIRKTQLFGCEKPLERFGETVSQHLYGGGGHMLTTTAFEASRQIVLCGKRTMLCILLLYGFQHLIREIARRSQATHEQRGLFFIWVQSVFKRSHSPNYNRLGYVCQACRPPAGGRQFIPMSKDRGLLPLIGRRAAPLAHDLQGSLVGVRGIIVLR